MKVGDDCGVVPLLLLVEGALDRGGNAPECDDVCASLCEASRIATLSSATVKVTSRLNRITSTRIALVCTVLLHHALRAGAEIASGESRNERADDADPYAR
ncbi:MAG: hypothetical protein JO079_04520 [Frankiaceae bacterium]|nr:hypothetical protein [Frankiaceae bacterium]